MRRAFLSVWRIDTPLTTILMGYQGANAYAHLRKNEKTSNAAASRSHDRDRSDAGSAIALQSFRRAGRVSSARPPPLRIVHLLNGGIRAAERRRRVRPF